MQVHISSFPHEVKREHGCDRVERIQDRYEVLAAKNILSYESFVVCRRNWHFRSHPNRKSADSRVTTKLRISAGRDNLIVLSRYLALSEARGAAQNRESKEKAAGEMFHVLSP